MSIKHMTYLERIWALAQKRISEKDLAHDSDATRIIKEAREIILDGTVPGHFWQKVLDNLIPQVEQAKEHIAKGDTSPYITMKDGIPYTG